MNKTFVTQPSLPPLEEFIPYLEKIWANKILTNNGEFHQLFEKKLAEYLGVKYVSLFTNGTLALITAIQTLRVQGEVITTPFSFVATAHSLHWNNIKPVFCDIKKEDGNIDEELIESLITPNTTAIVPVHVYGQPCNYDAIEKIAKTYGLKVIYDAAHAFNVKKNGESILNKGDLSIISFHATKIFNTFEGGAIISHDFDTKQRIDYLKNFGFKDETSVITHGINAKMNEFQASLGLLQLKYVDSYILKSKFVYEFYMAKLKSIKGLSFFEVDPSVTYNYSYFPILIDDSYFKSRDEIFTILRENDIFVRRYFYPLITDFQPYQNSLGSKSLPIALSIASKVICLPIYPELETEQQQKIIHILSND